MALTILDGGMGQELLRRSGATPTSLWSAAVMQDAPDLVSQVHCDFIAAGADVITLNSYSATPTRLADENCEDMFQPLQMAAIDAAHKARDRSPGNARIAGCLPPLPGSYQPGQRLSAHAAQDEYRRIVNAQAAHVDLFICETIPSVEEARIATRAAAESGLETWTALTLDETDGRCLRSGEPVETAAMAAIEEGAGAVLVNCSPPETIDAALDRMADLSVPIGAYANGFKSITPIVETGTVNEAERRANLDPRAYCEFAQGWAAIGAQIIGGCCEIGPAHIEELARHFADVKIASRA